ncbi:hypothetical protein CBA19CS22_32550 [Caballeronia novacaledonica]|uniref:Uncharacterized protein n=1 Tax=Caballeronia novacaledonica TaxID=1544861 RepID=A0ACB5R1Z3_9BURK|nr:hypothetical protein CBA19CS22_32550 [Caballeronia novacaledonica]
MTRLFDIALIGSGMQGLLQMTKEAEIAIESSNSIFRLNNHPEVIEYLERKKRGKVQNLGEEYVIGERRDLIYKRMAHRVLNEFRSTKAPVCLVTSGHPTYLVSPSQIIIRAAASEGINVRVVPGISSLDNIFADIGFDPGLQGFQSYEATDLILRDVSLNPETPLFIWQPGAFQNFFYSTRKSRPEQFEPLVDYLRKFYPMAHPIYVLRTPTLAFTKPECHRITVSSLTDLSEHLTLLHILFVPPLSAGHRNEALVSQLKNAAHMSNLTEEWPKNEQTPPDRAQVIRDIIKRSYEDTQFSHNLRERPKEVLTPYNLTAAEMNMFIDSDERKIFDYLGNEQHAFRREYGNVIDNSGAIVLEWNNEVTIVNK